VSETILNPDTFFIYLDLKGGLGRDYAFHVLRDAVHDMVLKLYMDKNLHYEFYACSVHIDIALWFAEMDSVIHPDCDIGKEKFVFKHRTGTVAARICVLVGDQLVNRLDRCSYSRLELGDMMFNIIDRKGNPDVPSVIFADEDRMVNLFTLKGEQ